MARLGAIRLILLSAADADRLPGDCEQRHLPYLWTQSLCPGQFKPSEGCVDGREYRGLSQRKRQFGQERPLFPDRYRSGRHRSATVTGSRYTSVLPPGFPATILGRSAAGTDHFGIGAPWGKMTLPEWAELQWNRR